MKELMKASDDAQEALDALHNEAVKEVERLRVVIENCAIVLERVQREIHLGIGMCGFGSTGDVGDYAGRQATRARLALEEGDQ